MVGLMRALRGVATGYMTGKLNIAAEKAKQDREDEVRKAENEFDLHKQGDYLKGLLNNSIEIDNNKHTNSANERQQIIEDEQKRLGLHLDSIGMSTELKDILKPYTYDWDTYTAYVDKNYPNLGDAWFKELVPFPEFKDMTYEEFILQGNKNFFTKDKNESNAQSTLQENNNVPSNASKVLTSRTLTEEKAGVEDTTVVSPFAPSFPENIEQQNIEQIARTGELPTEKEKQEVLFQGGAIPSTLFMPEILSAEDITPGQRSTRSKDILNVISVMGNFKDIIITDEGINLKGLYGNPQEQNRFNMLVETAERIARELEAEEGKFYNANEVVNKALDRQGNIQNIAYAHAYGTFDDVTKMALDAGVIDINEAYQRVMYEDMQALSEKLGNRGLDYYVYQLEAIAADTKVPQNVKDNATKLAANVRAGAYITKPEGFDEIAEKVDNAILGSISLEGEDVYDAEGNLIKEGDIDAPVFDIGSPGEKILGEEYLSEEQKKEEIKKKKITPITGDVSDYSEIIETLRAEDEFDEPIRLDKVKTQKWRIANSNPDTIEITLADGSTQILAEGDTFIEDKGIQGTRLQTVVEDTMGNLVLRESRAPKLKVNPKLDKLETLIKTLNNLEKLKDRVVRTKDKEERKQKLAERAKKIEQLRVEITALLKELQPEE
jgi:hypothetical protein